MGMSDPLNHLEYHSEPLEVPYYPNQFLGWDFFFAVSYSSRTFFLQYLGQNNFGDKIPLLILRNAVLYIFEDFCSLGFLMFCIKLHVGLRSRESIA